jgi:hypothetical protein
MGHLCTTFLCRSGLLLRLQGVGVRLARISHQVATGIATDCLFSAGYGSFYNGMQKWTMPGMLLVRNAGWQPCDGL